MINFDHDYLKALGFKQTDGIWTCDNISIVLYDDHFTVVGTGQTGHTTADLTMLIRLHHR